MNHHDHNHLDIVSRHRSTRPSQTSVHFPAVFGVSSLEITVHNRGETKIHSVPIDGVPVERLTREQIPNKSQQGAHCEQSAERLDSDTKPLDKKYNTILYNTTTMFRSSDQVFEDNLSSLTRSQQDDPMSEDDHDEQDSDLDAATNVDEDPRKLALEELESRVVDALENVMQHLGQATSSDSVQDELSQLLRPIVEIAAHTAPSIARTYYQGGSLEGVEASCDEVYQQIVSDLVLPSIFDIAQTDAVPAKRSSSLEFFRTLFSEFLKAGSWLDVDFATSANAGPYGAGVSSTKRRDHQQRQPPGQLKRRQAKRLQREREVLRYWVKASIACLTPGVFTSDASERTVASRGVIAASASIRPSLKHIAQRIKDADDRGANKVFALVMQMVEGVLKKLFFDSSETQQGDALKSSCIKFLEIVCLCCSGKPQDSSSRRKENTVRTLV